MFSIGLCAMPGKDAIKVLTARPQKTTNAALTNDNYAKVAESVYVCLAEFTLV